MREARLESESEKNLHELHCAASESAACHLLKTRVLPDLKLGGVDQLQACLIDEGSMGTHASVKQHGQPSC